MGASTLNQADPSIQVCFTCPLPDCDEKSRLCPLHSKENKAAVYRFRRSEIERRSREKNKQHYVEYAERYRETHREQACDYFAKYYSTNHETMLEYYRFRYAEGIDGRKAR